MAVSMFLKIDGIEGESASKAHAKEIDILAWSWGVSNSGSTHSSSGRTNGQNAFQDISITKYIDDASSDLLIALASGRRIKEATLEVEKASGGDGDGDDFLKIKLQDVIVNSYSTGGSEGEDRLTENITLNFAKVEFTYFKANKKGKVKADTEFKWDIKAGEPG